MSEEKAINVGPSRIEVTYERFGDPQAPPVLLVMGLGTQLLGWPDGFCAELVARGLHVIRFDNRDVGLSSHFADAPTPDVAAARKGDVSSASYTVSDMAADTVGLLDALGLQSAHIVGASMGGMIAQIVAIEHPGRSGPDVDASHDGQPCRGSIEARALRAMAPPPANAEVIDRTVAVFRSGRRVSRMKALGRTRAPTGPDPLGIARQTVAVSPQETVRRLRSIDVPTLVIHGADDLICGISGGRATAGGDSPAELVVIDGIGHNLPRALWPDISSITSLVQRAEAAAV